MKGVKYNMVFHTLDGSEIKMLGMSASDLMDTLPKLFKKHYGYSLNCNSDLINSLNKRAHKVSKFVREKVSITRIGIDNTKNTSKTEVIPVNADTTNNISTLTQVQIIQAN